jgi:protein-tyrosine phosphatase
VTSRSGPLRILAVCSHNRTRSVMMAALLGSMLADRESGGGPVAVVRSAGFAPPGLPAIAEAVDAMRRRGLDVSAHRSRRLTVEHIDGADLVLTAERDHVVRVASLVPSAFRRSMTMPEFVDRAAATMASAGTGADAGGVGYPARRIGVVTSMTASRTPQTYLADRVAEVADPTGMPSRDFEAAVVQLEGLCREVATVVHSWVG